MITRLASKPSGYLALQASCYTTLGSVVHPPVVAPQCRMPLLRFLQLPRPLRPWSLPLPRLLLQRLARR